jgi:polar amino acid transport system substrate-binding protein
MNRYFRFFGVFVVGLALSVVSVASDQQVVRFVTTTVEPWGYFNDRGLPDGLLVRFVNLLGREAGLPFTNRLQPYPRVKHSLGNGQADLAVMFVGPESNLLGESLGKVVDTQILMIGRKGMKPVETMESLDGRLVGYIRGSRYGKQFDEYRGFTKVPVNRMRQGIAMLLAGRLDAMVSTDQSLFYTLDKMDLDIDEVSPLLFIGHTQGDLFISHQASDPRLAGVYRQALQRLRTSGRLNPLFFSHDGWGEQWQEAQRKAKSAQSKLADY